MLATSKTKEDLADVHLKGDKPLEQMTKEELIEQVKMLEGETAEVDDGMDLSVVEDPCLDRNKRMMKFSVEDFKGALNDGGFDPCKVNEEAALKVEELVDEEVEEARANASKNSNKSDKSKKTSSSTSSTPTSSTTLGTTTTPSTSTSSSSSSSATTSTSKCSATHENCSKTKCCTDPGLQCYAKNPWWAMCRESCIPDVHDPADVDAEPWTCKEIGSRTPGQPIEADDCPDVWTNCMKTKCCKDPGLTCFAKNSTFGKCMPECVAGPQYFDLDNNEPWSCEQAGVKAPSLVGNWTFGNCSGDVDDCRETKCCRTSGFTCYEMNEGWAQCMLNCSTEPPADTPWENGWTCNEMGYTTPEAPIELPHQPLGGKVGKWVKDKCTKNFEDCSDTSCCVGNGYQCYQKDSTYATCAEDCKRNSTWNCKELGTRSYGLAYVGYPSLFCFTLLRVDTYELELVKYQWKKRAGIFACDGFVVFSDETTTIAGKKTLQTPKVEVGISKDGTAGNTELFMAVWDMVFEEGTVWDHDWTVKADPDAVLLSDRLRWRLEPHTNKWDHDGRLFVVNCNAWPGSSEFPMMYGSVEIFSQAAMRAYQSRVQECKDNLPWYDWGEDFFLTRCMDSIDVGRINDFGLIGDNVCVGPGQGGADECFDANRAAFHPFKEIDSWEWCFKNAIR